MDLTVLVPFDHPSAESTASSKPTPGREAARVVEAFSDHPDTNDSSGFVHERRGQLLYIEDNAVNVMLIEELVKTMPGLRIASESTGQAGIARAVALQPDLILIDLRLPDIDGFEVLHRLRAMPETARIRCIALSANAMTDDIERGLAQGFDDYWTKPIRFKPFLDALDALFPPMPQTTTAM